MRKYLVLALAVTSLLLACAGDSSEEREIADTVEGFFRALGEDSPLGENGLGRARIAKQGGRWRLADCDNFLAPD